MDASTSGSIANGGPFFDWLLLMLVGAVAFFLKRLIVSHGELQKEVHAIQTNVAVNLAVLADRELKAEVQELGKKVAVLLDRDRRRRILDYEEQDRMSGGG